MNGVDRKNIVVNDTEIIYRVKLIQGYNGTKVIEYGLYFAQTVPIHLNWNQSFNCIFNRMK